MNFTKINWKLNDGKTASTEINEEKVDATLEKLNSVTKAWKTEH